MYFEGFKSFSDPVEVHFEHGINGIVGPNGAGKSNISDGIRWVMGETSAKAIRGDKKTKFIFSGSASRKASKEAIVELEFDNRNRILPTINSDVVTITRKANLSGRSEYFINHKSCLLKDVQSAFLDTGLGRDSYSMISQEQSKKLLSEKIDERRAIFEEASGIVKMRTQKELSEKRLDEINTDFIRLTDILNELKKQVVPLQKQSKKASAYLILQNKLSSIEVNYIANRVKNLDSLIINIESQIILLQNENSKGNELLSTLESEVNILKADIKSLNEDIFSTQASFNEHSSRLENVRSEIKLNNERITNTVKEIDETDTEISELEQQVSTSVEDFSTKKVKFNENKGKLEALTKEKSEIAQSLFTLSEELSTKKMSSEELRTEITNLYNELQECKLRFEQCTKDEERLKKEIETFEFSDTSNIAIESSMNDITSLLNKLTIDLDIKNNSRNSLTMQISDLEVKMNNLNNESIHLNTLLARESASLSSLESAIENYDGFYEGVKNTLKHKENIPGVIDVVTNLMSVKPEHSTAIDTLASGFSQNIVTKTISDAKNAVKYLKNHNLGRATFIPLNDLSPRSFNTQELNLIHSFDGISLATDSLKFDSNYAALFQHLIGRNLVAFDISKATSFYEHSHIKAKIATLDGDIIQPGLISGGTRQSKRGVISKKQDIVVLKKAIAEKEERLSEVDSTIVKAKNSLSIYLEQLHSLDNEISALKLNISENQVKLSLLKQELDSNTLKSNEATIALKELHYQLSESKKLSSNLFKRRQELETRYNECSNLLSNTSSSTSTSESSLSSLKNRETEVLIEISQLEEENRNLTSFITSQELGKENLSAKLDTLKNKKAFAVSRLEVANTSIDDLIIQEADISKNCETYSIKIESMFSSKSIFEDRLSEKEEKLSELRKQLKSSTDKIHQLELEHQNSLKSIESFINNAKENYGLSKEELLIYEVKPFNEKQTQQNIFDLKKEIKSLGNVNIESIKDFEELNTRYISEKEQLEDVRNAKKDLENLLTEISTVMAEKFTTTFKSIALHFEEAFVELFGGGYAKLSLAEPKKPLDSQVDIIAQPPGKKPKSLELLSGGEKNLTVCALVFAILKAKPSPFVYLDEIDAPLDDANVARFAYYLQKIKGDTQFIVVTHRKGTMMASDRLFGVTQEIPGVTTIFPYQLINDNFDFDSGVANG